MKMEGQTATFSLGYGMCTFMGVLFPESQCEIMGERERGGEVSLI